MHNPEKFQQATIQAITDLQEMCSQTLARTLANEAMMGALVVLAPLKALGPLREEYEKNVIEQAMQRPPQYQRPEYWQRWSRLLEERQNRLQEMQDRGQDIW